MLLAISYQSALLPAGYVPHQAGATLTQASSEQPLQRSVDAPSSYHDDSCFESYSSTTTVAEMPG